MKPTSLLSLVAAVLVSGVASAQSAKSSALLSARTLIPSVSISNSAGKTYDGPWVEILKTTLRTSQQKDVLVGVSLETGLFTDTLVSSKNGNSDTSKSEASIEVEVLVDGKPAAPGVVIFNKREQRMMAQFGGILRSCTDANLDGTLNMETECVIDPEQLQLVLNTMSANHFNFSLDDLGTGVHTISVRARIGLKADAQTGSATAAASVGKGSITVEEVRFVKDQDITL